MRKITIPAPEEARASRDIWLTLPEQRRVIGFVCKTDLPLRWKAAFYGPCGTARELRARTLTALRAAIVTIWNEERA
jgi:hypothetical protein